MSKYFTPVSAILTAISLAACSAGGTKTKVLPDDAFPLPILAELPKENRFVVSPANIIDNILKDTEIQKISLPNGHSLVLAPSYESTETLAENEIYLGENYIFIEDPDGARKLLSYGWWFGGFNKSLFMDKAGGRIYIRETMWDLPEKIVREHDLKCTKTECALFTDRNCLLELEDPTAPEELEQEMKSHSARNQNHGLPADVQEKQIDKIFLSAMSGKKENVEYLFDREHLDKYFHFDAYISEIYGIMREHLIKYGKECFQDKTIEWPEK